MLGNRFARIVEECLHRLDRGENLPDVLADYPADAEQLKPLLLIAMASRSMDLPVPSQTAQRLGRDQMLAEMDQIGSSAMSAGTPLHIRTKRWAIRLVNSKRAQRLIYPAPSYRLAMIALLVIFGSGYFFLSASASPGDFFTAFNTDFQKVLAILNQGFEGFPLTDTSNLNQAIKINGGEELPYGVSGNVKVSVPLNIEEEDSPGYVYIDPYQERNKYKEGEGSADEEADSKKDQKLAEKEQREAEREADKEAREAEHEADKEAREAEREADKTLQQAELEDKLEQIKAVIEAKKDQKIIEKEEKEKD